MGLISNSTYSRQSYDCKYQRYFNVDSIHEFQTYKNVNRTLQTLNKNVEAEKIVETNLNNANSTSGTNTSEKTSEKTSVSRTKPL